MLKVKAWEELSIADNFIFQKVMLNEELCKKVLSEILGRKVKKIKYPEYEKTINIRRDSKGIRLDVYLEDEEDTVYNIEMQSSLEKNLPKRSRYYQGVIDLEHMEKGKYYEELNKSYVIFICTFDCFKYDQYKYTFTNKCDEISGLEMGDETTKIYLNTKGKSGNVSEDLKIFLDCVNGVYNSDDFSATIKKEVEKVKCSEKWRAEYMTLSLFEMDIKRESEREGREAGMKAGIKEGERLFAVLVQKLLTEGKNEELLRASNDEEFRKELYKKYGINEEV